MIGYRFSNGQFTPRYSITRLLVYGAIMVGLCAFWIGVGMVIFR